MKKYESESSPQLPKPTFVPLNIKNVQASLLEWRLHLADGWN
jgi:hypothetical protein